jgi:transcriptional regulator with XRE-family HTH domain
LLTVNDITKRRVDDWLESKGKSRAALAGDLGISPSHLSLILSGERTPSLELAVAIERLTGIPPKAFLEEVGR